MRETVHKNSGTSYRFSCIRAGLDPLIFNNSQISSLRMQGFLLVTARRSLCYFMAANTLNSPHFDAILQSSIVTVSLLSHVSHIL